MTVYTEEIAAQCASNGAQVLDASDPNWHLHIDQDTLDLSQWEYCILGQLYPQSETEPGYYSYRAFLSEKSAEPKWQAAMSALAMNQQDLYELLPGDGYPDAFLGFIEPDDSDTEDDEGDSPYYGWLQAAWLTEIWNRLA
jgi:hypothetical protein